MKRTTLYLPDDLKKSLERLSETEGRSEAEIIRSALRRTIEEAAAPKPRLPIAARGLGDPTVAERTDELLDGFGTR